MKLQPPATEEDLGKDLKTHEQLSTNTKELELLQHQAKKATGLESLVLNKTIRAGLKMVASAILADVEPGLPARRNCVAPGKVMVKCERFDRWTVFPGGKMPPSTAGKDACPHIFRQDLNQTSAALVTRRS